MTQRDYSHLPRARDFKLPKKISPELKEADGGNPRSDGSIAARRRKVWQKAQFLTHLFFRLLRNKLNKPQIAFSLFPSIVFYELTATSIDESTLKKYERWRKLSH